MINCRNCGAPHDNVKCNYCGTNYGQLGAKKMWRYGKDGNTEWVSVASNIRDIDLMETKMVYPKINYAKYPAEITPLPKEEPKKLTKEEKNKIFRLAFLVGVFAIWGFIIYKIKKKWNNSK